MLRRTFDAENCKEQCWQRKRWQVFSEVLQAFDAKLYSVAIPPAFAQAEGIVAHLFNVQGLKQDELKKRIDALHEDGTSICSVHWPRGVLAGFLERFDHRIPITKLNRNAVMHGADSNYGTRENAIAVIMWADYIMCAANDYKAIAIPKAPAEAAAIMADER